MRSDALKSLISMGESLHLEFKSQGVSPKTIAENVCAFLNSEGGYLVIGMVNDTTIGGVSNAKDRARAIQEELDKSISPSALWSVTVDVVDDKELIIVSVPPGPRPPYMCNDVIYSRRTEGVRTFIAKIDQVTDILERRSSSITAWDRLPASGLEYEDLDRDELQETIGVGMQRRFGLFADPGDHQSVLTQIGLSQYGRLTNACAVLFAKSPQRLLPQTRIRATAFSTHKGGDYIDNQLYEGNLFKLLKDLEAFLKRNTSISSSFSGKKLERDDHPYPFDAIREGLLNALMHRSYSEYDGGVSVGVYPDRIEIWNSGSLPEGMKIGDLKKSHPSRPHNPDIAYVLYLRMLIERVGRGTLKILDECRAAGLKQPKWSQDALGVTLTIFGRGANENKPAKPEISLNNRQKDLLGRTKPGEVFTLREYHASVADEASERSARRDLNELVQAGWLAREGATRSQHFTRTEKKA